MTAPGRSDLRRQRAGGTKLVVEAALEGALRATGILEPGGFEAAFAGAAGARGRTPTVRLALGDGGEQLLLRRLRHGGLLGPALGGLGWGLARAEAELHVTRELRAAGAPVPRAVLALGRRRIGPLFESALGTIYEEGTRDALAFLEAAPSRAALLRAAGAAGHAVRRLHDAGGSHPDLQVKNLLVRESPDRTECVVIDLDRARRLAALPPRRRMGQLMRLYRSLWKRGVLDRVGERGCARFFGAYCDGDRELRQALLARAPRELRRIAVHGVRYPTRRTS